jgi:hypothetical protein
VDGLRARARLELAEKWNRSDASVMFELVGTTTFSVQQLEEFQLGFRRLFRKSKQGVTRRLFRNILHRSARHLEPWVMLPALRLH